MRYPELVVIDGASYEGLTLSEATELCELAAKPNEVKAAKFSRRVLLDTKGEMTPKGLEILAAFRGAFAVGNGCAGCKWFASRGLATVYGECRDARYVDGGRVKYGVTPVWGWCSSHPLRGGSK